MDAPKCKNCDERHWGPVCPTFKTSGANGRVEARAKKARKGSPKAAGESGPRSVIPAVAERPSRPATGRTVAADRDATTPAPIKPSPTSTPVLGSRPPKAERRRAATAKTLAQARGEPSRAGGSANARQTLASIPPPIKPKRGRPRLGEEPQPKPWLAAGMSRRTWFRRQAERGAK